ncbi:transferase hexapeptide (six repeat-containing protein) [Falsiroseomonas stagni DSM 19981]|uniref:Transferase hexapeptide (Six repeat-containing protein) n=2 Tax=Falsiroseomonas TaxID=2870713 RepID=A0A1I4D2J3_9PROT|nr:transferase hexapeptide (six repeat-containing protein) [Falsiroseomonas stagni DSM 19981]
MHDMAGCPEALQAEGVIGEDRAGLPSTAGMEVFDLSAAGIAALGRRGVTVAGRPGEGNRVWLPREGSVGTLALTVARGGGHNTILLGPRDPRSRARISTSAQHGIVVLGGTSGAVTLTLSMGGERTLFVQGAEGSANALSCKLEGDGRRLLIGAGCMISTGVELRTSDSHAILDIAGGCQVNLPEDLVVGPHVWLGREVLVMKGVTIGRGSVIGARSVVTADVPDYALAAGVPARLLRQGVTWSRPALPDAARIAARIEEVAGR